MLKIITGRNTRYARRNAARDREETGYEGEYFLLPKKRKKEKPSAYFRRVWKMNEEAVKKSGGDIPEDQLTYARFKKEVKGRFGNYLVGTEGQKAERAVRAQARTQYTPTDQIEREAQADMLRKNAAIKKFEEWSGVKFDTKMIAYDSKTSTYRAGNVSFKWEYRKGKKGRPGGMEFTIRNMNTGQTLSGEDLSAEAASLAADRAMRREEKAMRLAKLKEENPAQWMAEEAIRLRRNEMARKRYRKKHPKRRRRK